MWHKNPYCFSLWCGYVKQIAADGSSVASQMVQISGRGPGAAARAPLLKETLFSIYPPKSCSSISLFTCTQWNGIQADMKWHEDAYARSYITDQYVCLPYIDACAVFTCPCTKHHNFINMHDSCFFIMHCERCSCRNIVQIPCFSPHKHLGQAHCTYY